MRSALLLVASFLACLCSSATAQTDSVFISTSGDTVVVWNIGVRANCAARFAFDIMLGTDTFVITERDTSTQIFRCTCNFDLYVVLPGTSHAGTYYVNVYRQFTKQDGYPVDTTVLIGSVQFTVGSAGTVQTSHFYQSPCHAVVGADEAVPATLRRFWLYQCYPNPFNPRTTIKYDSPGATKVNLTVYDILGREVSVLVNERKAPGNYRVEFDGSNLASGVYFYRLQAGDFVATKRLLLLK